MAMQDLLKADDIKKAMDTFKGIHLGCVFEQTRNYALAEKLLPLKQVNHYYILYITISLIMR